MSKTSFSLLIFGGLKPEKDIKEITALKLALCEAEISEFSSGA